MNIYSKSWKKNWCVNEIKSKYIFRFKWHTLTKVSSPSFDTPSQTKPCLVTLVIKTVRTTSIQAHRSIITTDTVCEKNTFSLGFLWPKLLYEMKKKINNTDTFEYSSTNLYNAHHPVCSLLRHTESYSFRCSMSHVLLKHNLVNSSPLLTHRFYSNTD